MKRRFLLFLFFCFVVVSFCFGAAPPPPATQDEVTAGVNRYKYVTPFTLSGRGISGAIGIVPGATLKASLESVTNGSIIQLGSGTYTVGASFLQTNLSGGTSFQGITLANKTNITVLGVPGGTIVDASAFGPGEMLFITNCSGLRFEGVTFRGWTNHNFMVLPPFNTGVLWSGIAVYKSEYVTFDNCIIERHTDHGILDVGAYNNGFALHDPKSTNNIVIRRCTFSDIGSYRTNSVGGTGADGAAIVSTGWTIENNYFDNCAGGIEPYDDTSGGSVFRNFIARNNRFERVAFFAIGTQGSIMCQDGVIEGNVIYNPTTDWSWHGTNYTSSNPSGAEGIRVTGGRGWTVRNNQVRGRFFNGFILGNVASPVEDVLLEGNKVTDLDRGDGLGVGFSVGDPTDSVGGAVSVRRLVARNNYVFNTAIAGFVLWGGRDVVLENNLVVNPEIYGTSDGGTAAMRIGTQGNTVNLLTNIVVRDNVAVHTGGFTYFAYVLNSPIASAVVLNNQAQGFVAIGGMTNRSGVTSSILGLQSVFQATIDLPSIGVNSQFTTNFTATGTRTNDHVTLMVPSQFTSAGTVTNVAWNVWGSNDVVYWRVMNNDAVSAANPQSVTVQAVVRRLTP